MIVADTDVLIEGHTDATGSEEYNLTLSRNRAQAVDHALHPHLRGLWRVQRCKQHHGGRPPDTGHPADEAGQHPGARLDGDTMPWRRPRPPSGKLKKREEKDAAADRQQQRARLEQRERVRLEPGIRVEQQEGRTRRSGRRQVVGLAHCILHRFQMGFTLTFFNRFVQLFKWNGRYIDSVGAAIFTFSVDIAVYFFGQGMGFLYDFFPGADRLDILRASLDASRQFTVRDEVVTAVALIHDTVARH